jgi:transcription initiation factor IIF auxiliary subunit
MKTAQRPSAARRAKRARRRRKRLREMCVVLFSNSHKNVKADVLQIDMDKLADGLQKLNEDDLLQVVQMVHDNKSADSYTFNDVERMSLFFFPRSAGILTNVLFL